MIGYLNYGKMLGIQVQLDTVDKKFLNKYPDLKILGTQTTGWDHIDLKEVKRRGIKFISLRGEKFLDKIPATAEHTMGLTLALTRKTPWAFESIKGNVHLQGYWNRTKWVGHELKGKTILLVGGRGRIGKMVAKYAKAFGMKVVVFEKNQSKKKLFSLLENADVVSIHIPLEGNELFFDGRCFWNMKPTSYLINTSRGGVVDERALLRALKKKKIAGAALDVVRGEPYKRNLALVEYANMHDNLLLTPHIGGATQESMEATEEFIANKIRKYLKCS